MSNPYYAYGRGDAGEYRYREGNGGRRRRGCGGGGGRRRRGCGGGEEGGNGGGGAGWGRRKETARPPSQRLGVEVGGGAAAAAGGLERKGVEEGGGNREIRAVQIELDDLFHYKDVNEEFLQRVTENTRRYIGIFAEAVDKLMPEPTEAFTVDEDRDIQGRTCPSGEAGRPPELLADRNPPPPAAEAHAHSIPPTPPSRDSRNPEEKEEKTQQQPPS